MLEMLFLFQQKKCSVAFITDCTLKNTDHHQKMLLSVIKIDIFNKFLKIINSKNSITLKKMMMWMMQLSLG
jgi:hypothetical protein